MYICLWSPSPPSFVYFGPSVSLFHPRMSYLVRSNPTAPTPYSHQPTYLPLFHLRLSTLLEITVHLFDLLLSLPNHTSDPLQPRCNSESQYQRFLPPSSSAAWPRPVPSPARTSVLPHHVFFHRMPQHVANIRTTVKARPDLDGYPRARGMLLLRHLQRRRRRPGRISGPSIDTHTQIHFSSGGRTSLSCGFFASYFFFFGGTDSPTGSTIPMSKIATLPGELTGAERS